MTLPTRTQIDGWTQSINRLFDSANSYRAAAKQLESTNDEHVAQIASPGGTGWRGDGADEAREASYSDRGAVDSAADHMRKLATIAENGAYEQQRSHADTTQAITNAESDSYTIGDDLGITDNYTYTSRDTVLRMERNAKAHKHLEAITSAAARLAAGGDETEQQLTQGAADLSGITPSSWAQATGAHTPTIQMASFGAGGLGGVKQDGPTKPSTPECHLPHGLGALAAGGAAIGRGIQQIVGGHLEHGLVTFSGGAIAAWDGLSQMEDCAND